MRNTRTLAFGALTKMAKVGLASLCLIPFLVGAPQARADEFAYEVNSDGQFGFIDLNTGAFTNLGTLSVTLCGLAVHAGHLYGYGPCGTSGTLYEVNPANGTLTTIGTAPFAYRGLGSTTQGLYGFDQSMNLYSVNPNTGATKLIGSTGLSNPSGFGVSDGLGTLYITPTFEAGCSGTWLYSVNTRTAVPKQIGLTGLCGIGAMAVQDGKLYAGVFSPFAVYTLSTKTGTATFLADISGTSGYFYGLAPSAQTAP